MKNKKVLFFTLGKQNVASSRIRVYHYLPFLEKAGFVCSVISYTSGWHNRAVIKGRVSFPVRVLNKFYSWISILRLILNARRFDVIFIQRVLLTRPLFNLLRRLNPSIVFDFDDAIHTVNKYNRFSTPDNKFLVRLNYIVKNAAYVITTQSEFNQSFARALNRNVTALTSPVDTARYLPVPGRRQDKREIVLGWIGSPKSTCYLRSYKDMLCAISRKYPDLTIEFIGAEKFDLNAGRVVFKDWTLETEVANLRNFDIGIMPLDNDVWSRNKYYKLLQYLSLGIPAVASAIGVCSQTIKDGVNGFLAASRDEWIEKLSLLIEDTALRERIGIQARKTAEARYSYEVASPVLIKILQGEI